MLDRLIDRLFRRKRHYRTRLIRDIAKVKDLNTQQRKLEGLISDLEGRKPQFSGILTHLYEQGWNMDEIFDAYSVLDSVLFREGADVPSEAITLIHNAIEYGSLRQSYGMERYTPAQQFDMAVGAISRAVTAHAPSFVYSDIWDKWHGNKDAQHRNSQKFAYDLGVSAPGLEIAGSLTKKARSLLMRKVDRIVGSANITYGDKVQKIGAALTAADSNTPIAAYELCEKFSRKDILDECPTMYKHLLRLPPETSPVIFSFIETAIGYIGSTPSGIRNKRYADTLSKVVYKLSFLLRGGAGKEYKRNEIAGFFSTPFTADQAETLMTNYNQFLGLIMEGDNAKIQLRIDDIKRLFPRLQNSVFDANVFIIETTRRLRKEFGDKSADHFEDFLIKNLRDTENAMDLIVFADAYYKKEAFEARRSETPLSPFEKRIYSELVKKAYKESTKRREERQRLVELVREPTNTRPVPAHVYEFYSKHFSVAVPPMMLDIGKDNNAWYRWNESADSYMDLNDETDVEARIGKELALVKGVSRHLVMNSRMIRQPKVAVIGLACGDAWPEILLSDELSRYRFKGEHPENVNVWLKLYDINDTMVNRAAYNCDSRKIRADVRRKDIRKIQYSDLGSLERQLVITLFGRTYFNLETESNKLIDSLKGISIEHRQRGNMSPTLILMEGAESSNMDYYWDPRAEGMHVTYFIKRLETDSEVVCIDPSSTQRVKLPSTPNARFATSTYAAIQSPEKDRVEFYFMALKPCKILGGEYALAQHQLVRCGESRIISPALIESFTEKGFNYDIIRPEGSHAVTLVLVLREDMLFDQKSPGRR
jgi:hypothetical protein